MMADVPLTWNEALSGIFGSVSLASWIFLLLPQLYENYKTQSAAGVSIPFLIIWFIGDITNLSGALWARLVPTVIALAVYFCCLDAILISQCLYYNLWVNRNKDPERSASNATAESYRRDSLDDEPLLSRVDSNNSSIGLPGSHNRRRRSTLTKISEDEHPAQSQQLSRRMKSALLASLHNIGAVLGVCFVGAVCWALAWKIGFWTPAPAPHKDSSQHGDDGTPLGASVLGYISALAYLGARVPQIMKNWREKSCEGLSLLFFLLSLLGNLTYGASILSHSLDRDYIITNLPWLIGSLGTIFEDCTIFLQFHIYGDEPHTPEPSTG